MNRFILKVSAAAVVIALAGVAGASQAKAQSTGATNSSWFNTYAADAIANASGRAPLAAHKTTRTKSAAHATFRYKRTGRFHPVKRSGVRTRHLGQELRRNDGQLGRLN